MLTSSLLFISVLCVWGAPNTPDTPPPSDDTLYLAFADGTISSWDANGCTRPFASCPSYRWESLDSSVSVLGDSVLAATRTNVYIVKRSPGACAATALLTDDASRDISAARVAPDGTIRISDDRQSTQGGIYATAAGGAQATQTPTQLFSETTDGTLGYFTSLGLLPDGTIFFGFNGTNATTGKLLTGVFSIESSGAFSTEFQYGPSQIWYPLDLVTNLSSSAGQQAWWTEWRVERNGSELCTSRASTLC